MTADHETIIGIDLGTTNSLVALCDAAGPRVLVDESAGDDGLLPSVVHVDEQTGRVTIGRPAAAHAVERPHSTIHSIKRLMGKGYGDLAQDLPYLPYRIEPGGEEGADLAVVVVGERRLTPQEVSAMILGELRGRAEKCLGHAVSRAVITVPAYFDDAQRQATRDAGRIAGLEVVRIVNEPTAAALAYGLDRSESATLAVYDLGGGTFDISILRVHEGVFEVLATDGDTHLGGDDFDRTIIDVVKREIEEQFGLSIDSPAIRQQLRTLSEQIKIRLSDDDEAPLEIDLGRGRVYRRAIGREELEGWIDPLVSRTEAACRRALGAGRVEASQIDQVVMVGGSTRVPFVRQRVANLFGRKPYTALNPEEVVALGAAVQASILAGRRRDTLLIDVTPLSLGIETLGGAMAKLIMANASVPARATERFTTFQDGQTNVKINVLQGERELVEDCRSLGVFELRGIPPMAAGMPKIDVTFLIDQNGILNVTAKEQRSGTEASVQVVPAHGLTPQQVERLRAESVAHAREDMTAHRLIDLRNQVVFDANKVERMLAAHGDALTPDLHQRIVEAMAALREYAVSSTDCDEIARRLKSFDELTVPLAEAGITRVLRESREGE